MKVIETNQEGSKKLPWAPQNDAQRKGMNPTLATADQKKSPGKNNVDVSNMSVFE